MAPQQAASRTALQAECSSRQHISGGQGGWQQRENVSMREESRGGMCSESRDASATGKSAAPSELPAARPISAFSPRATVPRLSGTGEGSPAAAPTARDAARRTSELQRAGSRGAHVPHLPLARCSQPVCGCRRVRSDRESSPHGLQESSRWAKRRGLEG